MIYIYYIYLRTSLKKAFICLLNKDDKQLPSMFRLKYGFLLLDILTGDIFTTYPFTSLPLQSAKS